MCPPVYCQLFRKLVLGKSCLIVHYDTHIRCRTNGLTNWLPVPTYVSLIVRVEKQRSFFNRLTFLSRECSSKGLFREQNTFAIYISIRRSVVRYDVFLKNRAWISGLNVGFALFLRCPCRWCDRNVWFGRDHVQKRLQEFIKGGVQFVCVVTIDIGYHEKYYFSEIG